MADMAMESEIGDNKHGHVCPELHTCFYSELKKG